MPETPCDFVRAPGLPFAEKKVAMAAKLGEMVMMKPFEQAKKEAGSTTTKRKNAREVDPFEDAKKYLRAGLKSTRTGQPVFTVLEVTLHEVTLKY